VAEITVVVPARDASATIGRTLAALAVQDVAVDYEVVVVDSGSRDDTAEVAAASGVATAVLRNPGGEPAGSRNIGVRHGTGRVLAFTDADCEPVESWLAGGLKALERADIVQGKVLPVSPHGPFDRTLSVVREYGLYETANLFVRREVFERVGGFQPVIRDEADSRPFGEDVWFVWRTKRTGARTVFADDALVYHSVFPRGFGDFLAEQARARYFPMLVALIPELRRHFLQHRLFLTPESARFDLAVSGLVASAISGRRLPGLAGLVWYAARLEREARRWPGSERSKVACGRILADVVTCGALLRGSVDARTLVL
jgi:glycosyltransferase involved in cell wall biosynthesis